MDRTHVASKALALRIASGNGEDASGGDSGDGGEADVSPDVGDESGGSGGGISRRPSSKVSTSSRRGSSHSRRAHSTAENGGSRPKPGDVEELQWDNEDEMSRESEKQKPLRRSAGGSSASECESNDGGSGGGGGGGGGGNSPAGGGSGKKRRSSSLNKYSTKGISLPVQCI